MERGGKIKNSGSSEWNGSRELGFDELKRAEESVSSGKKDDQEVVPQ